MRRLLLILSLCIIASAVWSQPNFATVAGPAKNTVQKQPSNHPDQFGNLAGVEVIGQKRFDNTIIGNTWYDVQSYTNVMQRIWAYDDGTIGATWMSAGQNLMPERGTGYNYFDGNSWGTPNPHVGPADRMGWPSYAPWGPEGEIVSQYLYVAGSGPIKFYKRPVKGTGEWIETALSNPNSISLVWHSMMTSGESNEYIHLLAFTYDAPYNGQDNALLYYRSSDGAETWDIDGVVIDGLGSDYYLTISSLTYAWANPVGETIAFTYGFNEYGGKIFKSYDNGENWEMIEVFETGLDALDPPEDTDDIPCGTGNSAIVLDSQGNAHVAFSRMVKIFTGGELFYYPYTDGLIYWTEGMPVLDTAMISSYTLEYLYEAGNLIGWIESEEPLVIATGQPNYGNSMYAFPQMSIDEEDNLFVAASVIAPGYDNTVYFYRHILVSSSFDGGNSWNEPVDVNDDIFYIISECAYPEMAPVIGNEVLLLFQEDVSPGINQWLNNHDPTVNNMMFMSIPKDDFVGAPEKPARDAVNVSVYPNPASIAVYANFIMKEGGMVKADLTSQTGQRITGQTAAKYHAGYHQIRLGVDELPAGLYFFTLNISGQPVTRKIVVR